MNSGKNVRYLAASGLAKLDQRRAALKTLISDGMNSDPILLLSRINRFLERSKRYKAEDEPELYFVYAVASILLGTLAYEHLLNSTDNSDSD